LTNKIVLASGNKGKVTELAELLGPLDFDVLPQSEFAVPEVAESGTTFVENAIIKARHAALITGLPAIADDSGLAVDALGGAPGVYSARFAGLQATDRDNIDKLLIELKDVPQQQRQARFLCVLVFMQSANDPTPIICQGEWHGEISLDIKGENGFGYDPVFWLADLNRSSAQLIPEEKNALSHRGKAIKLLVEQVKQRLGHDID
jgi:XTP/dITP diphosphohydrolase